MLNPSPEFSSRYLSLSSEDCLAHVLDTALVMTKLSRAGLTLDILLAEGNGKMNVKYDRLTTVISVVNDIVESTNMPMSEQIEFCDMLSKVFALTAGSLKEIYENGDIQEDENASDAR